MSFHIEFTGNYANDDFILEKAATLKYEMAGKFITITAKNQNIVGGSFVQNATQKTIATGSFRNFDLGIALTLVALGGVNAMLCIGALRKNAFNRFNCYDHRENSYGL